MGEAYSPDTLRGLLVPFSWATISAANTDLTEDAARPGLPEASTATAMVLQSSGEQSAGTRRVQVQRGGFAGTSGATFIWDDNDDDWRGWNVPVAIHAAETVAVHTLTSPATTGELNPDLVTLTSNTIVAARCRNAAGVSTVGVYTGDPGFTAWSSVSVIHSETNDPDGTGAHSFLAHPALTVTPSGRVLCFFMVYGPDDAGQVRMYASDDDGATWSEAQRYCLPASIDTSTATVERMAAATNANGQTVLIISVDNSTSGDEELWQYASNDLGASFTLVHAGTVSLDPFPNVPVLRADVTATADSRFFVSVTIFSGGTVKVPGGVLLPQAFSNVDDVGALFTFSAGYSIPSTYDLTTTVALADDGVLYQHTIGENDGAGTAPIGETAVSYDNGETWERLGRDEAGTTDGRWFATGNDAVYPSNIRTAWHRGGIYMLSNAAQRAATATNQNSLYGARYGRYSNVTLPSVDLFTDRSNGLAWTTTWAGMASPAGAGFAASGTASQGLNAAGYWESSGTGGRNYRATPTVTIADGVIAELRGAERTDGTGTHYFEVLIDDATNDYGVRITMGSTITAVDSVSAGAIGSSKAVSGGTDLRVAIAAGKVSIWYRPFDMTGVDDWLVFVEDQALTDGGGTGTNRVAFGIDAGSTVTAQWRDCAFAESGSFAENQATGFTNPDDLRGHPLSGSASGLGDSLSIRATGGPAVRGDTWSIVTEHDYPVEHQDVLQHPSPNQPWRGATVSPWVAAAKSLTYDLDDFDGMYQASGLWGWVLMGCNVPEVRIAYLESSVWSTIATVDRTTSYAFERSGAFVVPATTGTDVAGHYVERGELKGGWWYDGTSKMRKIASNTGGYLTSGATHEQSRCRIRLEGADDTEQTNGTGWVLPPNSTILLHDALGRNNAEAIRITYDPSATMPEPPEGQMVAGVSSPGEVVVWGVDSGATRRRQIRPNTEITDRRDGRRTAANYGPARETRSISWTEGVDTQYTNRTAGDDWVMSTTTSGTRPVADRRSVPMELAGLIRELNGSKSVVVDLPYIPSGTPDAVHLGLNRMGGALLCRLTGDLPLETLMGDEVTDELIRVSIVAEEEV